MLHFWVDPAKHLPVHCMESALIPFETVVVVINEGRKSGLSAESHFKTSGDGDAINRYHDPTFGVEWNLGQRGGVFVELHGCQGIGLCVHLCVERKVFVI